MTGDDAITGNFLIGHAEVITAVLDEHIPFFEAAFVEQHLDAFARRELTFGVLRRDALLATTQTGLGTALIELFENVLHRQVEVDLHDLAAELAPTSVAIRTRAMDVTSPEANDALVAEAVDAKFRKPLGESRVFHCARDLRRDTVDNRLRRAARRVDAVPADGADALEARRQWKILQC